MARPAAGGLTAGREVGGRYRLHRPLGTPGSWLAEDMVLARPVALRLHAGDDRQRAAFLATAARAGRARDHRLAEVYDAAEEHDPDGTPVAYAVREWVEGRSLAELVAVDGPLPPERATAVLHEVAWALVALHQHGLAHGHLTGADVLLRPDGEVRVTDAGLHRSLTGDLAPGLAEDDSPLPIAAGRPDLDALGELSFDILVPAGGAAVGHGQVVGALVELGLTRPAPTVPSSPRQVRAAVPRDLDALVTQLRDPDRGAHGLDRAAAVATALAALPSAPEPPRPSPPAGDPRRQMLTRRGLAALAAVAVLVGLWALIAALTRSPAHPVAVPSFTPTAPRSRPATAPRAVTGALLPVRAAVAFDPGGDGTEQDALVPLAVDGSPTTAWHTDTYATADLGHLKPGVGLLLDLGTTVRPATVTLQLGTAGTGLQLLTAATRGNAVADYAVAAAAADAPATVTLHPDRAGRYWVVWLTRLPPAAGGFRGTVAGISFRR